MKPIRLLIMACPKPFVEPFSVIQQNAINSWKSMKHPNVTIDVTLIGDEHDVGTYAETLGCNWISTIKKNRFGTPLVDDIFKQFKSYARNVQSVHPDETVVCCYINADIVVFDHMLKNIVSFLKAKDDDVFDDTPKNAQSVWLLVGSRWDTDNVGQFDFSDKQWDKSVIERAKQSGKDHGCWGIDYFIFGPQTFSYIYPFAIGKFVWDRWLVGNVFRRDSITVDITKTNFVVHQNGPWYQLCRTDNGSQTNDRKALFDTEEVLINQSFDYYEKDINTGTRWETDVDENGTIVFNKKLVIPRSD